MAATLTVPPRASGDPVRFPLELVLAASRRLDLSTGMNGFIAGAVADGRPSRLSTCCDRRRSTRPSKARAAHPGSRPLGGGTDLVVNIRRGIVAPPVLIDMNRVPELHAHQGR